VNLACETLAIPLPSLTGVSDALAISITNRWDSFADTKLLMSSRVSSGDQSCTDQFFWKPLNTRRGVPKLLAGSAT
jgi:hypothetical protein